MYIFAIVFLAFFLPALSPAAEPQPDDTLGPVVVTATRVDTPSKEVTTTLSVITAGDIQAKQAVTVEELLRDVPGLDVVQSGSRGNETSVFIRGANSTQVLVLVDGMEVNSVTAGNFDFAHLSTDNVERIEVLRGAGGALYGSKAVGGVINIITKKGQGAPRATLSTEGGNGSTHKELFSFLGGEGPLGYSFSSSYLRSNGFRSQNDGYRNGAVSTRLDYSLLENGSLTALFNMTDSRLGLVNNNNSSAVLDPDAEEKDQHYTGRLEWRHRLGPQWDYRVSLGASQSHERFSDPDHLFFSSARTLIEPLILAPQFQTSYRLESGHLLTFGADLDMRRAKFTDTDSFGSVTRFKKSEDNQAPYFQDQWKLLEERLILVGGLRYDHNGDFGSAWSPSASGAYLIDGSGTKLKASYARGFRAPTFNDLFFPGSNNPHLNPEVSWEFDTGVEQRLWTAASRLEVTYFHREVKDLIVFRGLSPKNVGLAVFDGVETGLQIPLGRGFSFKGNYTYVDFNERLTRRPKHKGNVGLNYRNGPFELNLDSNIVGHRLDVDAVTFNTINKAGYSRFDLASSYALPWRAPGIKQISLFGKIENLLNRRYQEADGFRARPLNFLLGLRGTFGKD